MLDRESTFAQPELVRLLQTRFVPVAIDQANQRRQKDTEGEFYRKIASQNPRNDFSKTTQGFYVASAAGELLLYNNNRDPEKVLRLVKDALQRFEEKGESSIAPIVATKVDKRYAQAPSEGQLVVRVRAKVLGGYEPTQDRWLRIFQSAVSRDNLWITKGEHEALARGEFPASLQTRIARFHLVDNTRGEPMMWAPNEVRSIKFDVTDGKITGSVKLATESRDAEFPRTYDCQLKGAIEVKDGQVVRFDMVALGQCSGEGRYTRRAPKGKFPLAVSFTLADGSDVADKLPPQGARGWLDRYMKSL